MGKTIMLREGYFRDIDLALMTHANPETNVDVKSLALRSYRVRFHGVSAHAAIKPEDGRSALDALMLACHGLECLREHVRDDVRMHYNSDKPAAVQALAYTQGTDIHVAPGQEQHLPHEVWHVAQ